MGAGANDEGALKELLTALGEHLKGRGLEESIVVVGGAALCLRGLVPRTTRDVDVIATTDRLGETWERPELSEALLALVARVARDFAVDEDWLNAVIGQQWVTGLPPFITEGVDWLSFGGLQVGLAGRRTLIALKLFAEVDRVPNSVHLQDLFALAPTDGELEEAHQWVLTQDASSSFPEVVLEVVDRVRSAR